MMTIEPVTTDKKQYLPLLLLADEQETMIDRYLSRGEMFVMYNSNREPICSAVVTDEGNETCELKSLAVSPQYQRRGYGRQMIAFLCHYYSSRFALMLVGTGDTVSTVSFYKSCGFSYSHTIPDFFTLNYDHPIVEDGKVVTDKVCFCRRLFVSHTIDRENRTDVLISSLAVLWEKSVRASHHFLTEEDIAGLIPLVPVFIQSIKTLVVLYQKESPVAFMGVEDRKIEMLFVAPEYFGCGFGKELIHLAIKGHDAVYVDVNEQNPGAEGFYRHMGFRTFERTETDEQGNPFPILKMQLV